MARMIMLEDKRKAKTERSASASLSEGEQARQILEANGYVPRNRTGTNGQFEFPCPFHEEPGAIAPRKATNFYLDKNTSKYYCQAASCGQKGNLLTLERFFGLDNDPNSAHRTLEQRLREYETQLTQDKKDFLRDKQGLSEKTLERFRIGYDQEHGNYLIPYMEGRRPIAFRWYNPEGKGPSGSKYWWEPGTFATLFNAGDGVGDPVNGRVLITEGEWKAMIACQFGYAAVSLPGAAQWKPEWSQVFNHCKEIIVCLDNDRPESHRKDDICLRCKPAGAVKGQDSWTCTGHNPGQDGAAKVLDVFGHRARNVVLPLETGFRKTDLNEYIVRDGHSLDELSQLLLGLKASPFLVRSLGQIYEEPPEEAQFIISDGILPVGGRLLVTGAPKAGKEQSLSTPVLTPHGWTTMGELSVGDQVVNVDGQPATITHVHPQGVKPLYRVTMSDGSSTICGNDHLWTVTPHGTTRSGASRDSITLTTAKIAEKIKTNKRFAYIPVVEPVQYNPRGPLPLDPYGLGLLLGDGGFGTPTPTFTKPDLELHEALMKAFPDQRLSVIDASQGSVRLSGAPGRGANPLTVELRQLGLWGCRSWEKFLPEQYLRASTSDRLAVLQGLLDTDGWVEWNASHEATSAHFGTSSERLKDGVIELVESLGGTTRVQSKPTPKFQDGGVGRSAWSVRVRLPQQFEPFRLTRKLAEWLSGRPSKNTRPTRRIISVEYSHDEEAQCITIDRADGLYVTERFIVTHNSIFIENLALSIASGVPFLRRFNINDGKGPSRVLLLDRELSARSLFDRLDSLIASRPGYALAADNLMIDHQHRIILDTPEAAGQLVGLIRANNVQVIILDTAYKFFSGDVEKASSVMKAFATLDEVIKETGVSVVLTHHHRKSGGGKGAQEMPSAEQVTGSLYWTGWPNGTVLINFLDRAVDKPFNTVASFVAFRDAAPPEPLALMRDKTSIAYNEIKPHTFGVDEDGKPISPNGQSDDGSTRKLNGKNLAQYLLECAPILEDEFISQAAQEFNQRDSMIKIHLLDILDRHPDFERDGDGSRGAPYMWRFKYEPVEEPYKGGELENQISMEEIPA